LPDSALGAGSNLVIFSNSFQLSGFQLSAISHQLSAISFQRSALGSRPTSGFRLPGFELRV